jgi:hypothetical protein
MSAAARSDACLPRMITAAKLLANVYFEDERPAAARLPICSHATKRGASPPTSWVRQRYINLIDHGINAPLSPPDQSEIMQLSQRWREHGLPQTALGAPFLEREMS